MTWRRGTGHSSSSRRKTRASSSSAFCARCPTVRLATWVGSGLCNNRKRSAHTQVRLRQHVDRHLFPSVTTWLTQSFESATWSGEAHSC